MAFQLTGNTVISDSNILSTKTLQVNNDNGVIEILDTSPMVGTVAGYASGGWSGSPSNVIDKFPFANESTSTDVGDLTKVIQAPAGHSSSIFGYVSSGGPAPTTNTIEKFPFAINNNARDVGDLSQARGARAGQSSFTHGYTSGGSNPGNPAPTVSLNTIDKFPFSADSNATDVGDLTQTRGDGTGHSSATDGFMAGAYSTAASPTSVNTIDRFSFAVDNNASDVGDLAVLTGSFVGGGKSSKTHGYVAGGSTAPVPSFINTIQKFQFSTSANATDIADLATPEGRGGSGQNSLTSGYHSGGRTPTETHANDIQKFPFATDSNATEVGSLTVGRYYAAGQQD